MPTMLLKAKSGELPEEAECWKMMKTVAAWVELVVVLVVCGCEGLGGM